jgi:hypothetical protein
VDYGCLRQARRDEACFVIVRYVEVWYITVWLIMAGGVCHVKVGLGLVRFCTAMFGRYGRARCYMANAVRLGESR